MKSSTHNKVEWTVSNRTIIRIVGLVILALVFLKMVQQAAFALSIVGIALFLALALNAPVSWIARHLPGRVRGSRKLGTTISFLIVVALLVGFIASVAPPLVRQTNTFIKTVPTIVDDLRSENSSLGRFIRQNNLEDQTDKVSKEVSGRMGDIGGGAIGTLGKVSTSLFATLTVLVMSFMMLIEGPGILKFGYSLVPKQSQPRVRRIANSMYKVIKGYVNGQVTLAAVAALMIIVPLLILGVSYPVALMVIVFICGLIPMVGHTIGASIITVVALFHSPVAAIIILAYYTLYQQIENYTLQPKIQANSTDMSPLLVFGSVVIGVSFSGLIGGLLAIPIAGCIRILAIDYLESSGRINRKAAQEAGVS
jgi:predicted PurR-regulated permease PerM